MDPLLTPDERGLVHEQRALFDAARALLADLDLVPGDAVQQFVRRPALDDPVADLRQPIRVGGFRQRRRQSLPGGGGELPRRLSAQQMRIRGRSSRLPTSSTALGPSCRRHPALQAPSSGELPAGFLPTAHRCRSATGPDTP